VRVKSEEVHERIRRRVDICCALRSLRGLFLACSQGTRWKVEERKRERERERELRNTQSDSGTVVLWSCVIQPFTRNSRKIVASSQQTSRNHEIHHQVNKYVYRFYKDETTCAVACVCVVRHYHLHVRCARASIRSM
jgi:hypothetical protein